MPPRATAALEMQNLSVTDNRAFLVHHLDSVAKLGAAPEVLAGLLGQGDQSSQAPSGDKK